MDFPKHAFFYKALLYLLDEYNLMRDSMRPRTRPPLNRRYFHTKPRRDKRDIAVLKKKITALYQKKKAREREDQETPKFS